MTSISHTQLRLISLPGGIQLAAMLTFPLVLFNPPNPLAMEDPGQPAFMPDGPSSVMAEQLMEQVAVECNRPDAKSRIVVCTFDQASNGVATSRKEAWSIGDDGRWAADAANGIHDVAAIKSLEERLLINYETAEPAWASETFATDHGEAHLGTHIGRGGLSGALTVGCVTTVFDRGTLDGLVSGKAFRSVPGGDRQFIEVGTTRFAFAPHEGRALRAAAKRLEVKVQIALKHSRAVRWGEPGSVELAMALQPPTNFGAAATEGRGTTPTSSKIERPHAGESGIDRVRKVSDDVDRVKRTIEFAGDAFEMASSFSLAGAASSAMRAMSRGAELLRSRGS